MKHAIVNEQIKVLLDETTMSFNMMLEAGGHPNMDYAEYASRFSLMHFRSALQNPDLSRAALAAMLRRGKKQCSIESRNAADCWANYISSYVDGSANSNVQVS